MMGPGVKGRGTRRLGIAQPQDSAMCPLPCIALQDTLANESGEARATECRLCGQITARWKWIDLFRRREA